MQTGDSISILDRSPRKMNHKSRVGYLTHLHSPVYDLLGKRIAVLILDESHYAKNPASKVYKAIHLLRYHRALLLTATPMFNNWLDMPKQMGLLPGGGPFIDEQHISAVFGLSNGNANEWTKSSHKALFERLACAITVARPKSILHDLQKPEQNIVLVAEPPRWVRLAISYYVRKGRKYLAVRMNSIQRTQANAAAGYANSAAGYAMLSIATQLASNPLMLQVSNPPKIDVDEIKGHIQATLSKRFPTLANVDALDDTQWSTFEQYCDQKLKLPEKANYRNDNINDDGPVDDAESIISEADTAPGDIASGMTEFIMDVEGSEEPQSLPLGHDTSFTGGEEVNDDLDGSIPVTLPSAEKLAKSQYWKSKLSSTEVEDIISPRVHAVLDCVRKDYDSFPGQKTMVVSASLRFLQLIAEAIKRELHHLEVVEYNGEVPPKERARRLEKINTQGGSSILLLTAGAGGTGLNVTGVSHVLLTEPQWNLGLEVQIIGRSYRLGQKHQVRVSKLFCEKSAIDNLVEQIKQKKEAVTKPMYDFLIREDQEPFSPTPLPFNE
ncbi:hypothetical protein V2G26_017427 [Clonostachys chloroleuca]